MAVAVLFFCFIPGCLSVEACLLWFIRNMIDFCWCCSFAGLSVRSFVDQVLVCVRWLFWYLSERWFLFLFTIFSVRIVCCHCCHWCWCYGHCGQKQHQHQFICTFISFAFTFMCISFQRIDQREHWYIYAFNPFRFKFILCIAIPCWLLPITCIFRFHHLHFRLDFENVSCSLASYTVNQGERAYIG